MSTVIQWESVDDALPPPHCDDEPGQATTSETVWLWSSTCEYGSMGWYDYKRMSWQCQIDFRPTHWAYVITPH